MSQPKSNGEITHIGALRERAAAAMIHGPLVLILVAADILPLLRENSPVLNPEAETYMGIPILEDPGLESGMVEMIDDTFVAKRRLELIKRGLTIAPDGLVKPANWWRK